MACSTLSLLFLCLYPDCNRVFAFSVLADRFSPKINGVFGLFAFFKNIEDINLKMDKQQLPDKFIVDPRNLEALIHFINSLQKRERYFNAQRDNKSDSLDAIMNALKSHQLLGEHSNLSNNSYIQNEKRIIEQAMVIGALVTKSKKGKDKAIDDALCGFDLKTLGVAAKKCVEIESTSLLTIKRSILSGLVDLYGSQISAPEKVLLH